MGKIITLSNISTFWNNYVTTLVEEDLVEPKSPTPDILEYGELAINYANE